MRKKWFRKVVSAGLVLTMLAALTACGKGEEAGSNVGGGSGKKDPNAALAKQYVYKEQDLGLPDLGDDYYVQSLTKNGDRIYAIMQVYSYAEGQSETSLKLLSWKQDGTDIQMKDLDLYMEGQEPEIPKSENTDNSTPNDENETVDNGIAVMPMARDTYTYSSVGVSLCTFAADGSAIYGIKNSSFEDNSDPENYVYKNETSVCCWNMDGKMQWDTIIEGLQTEESWGFVQSLIPTKDGKLSLLISGDKQEKMDVAADGTLSERKPLNGNNTILSNASAITVNNDGTLSVIYYNESDNYSMYLASYDIATDTYSEGIKLPDSIMNGGYNSMVAGNGADLVYTNTSGVFYYNTGDTEPTQVMSFINSDMMTTYMNSVFLLDDEHLMGFYTDDTTGKMKGGFFTKVNPEDIPDKSVLVLAGNYVDYDVKQRVVNFNKTSEKYRIVVKEYQQYNTSEDYMAGYTQMNNDILSGSMPDILVADLNMPVENYISKGLIADIGEMIQKDEELSQKEFMENVFDAYKVNDKLYYVIPSFNVRTMIAKKAWVGDRTTWTMKDMQEVVASMPEGSQGIGDLTRDSFFYTMMQYCGNDFVDVSTGKCNFNSPDFINMLNYAKSLPTEFGEDYWGEDYWATWQSQYRDDRTLLLECYISSARDMTRNINGFFGEDISYIGFPTESGKGSIVIANQKYVISAKSKNQEGAWEFLRYYLTDEYQGTLQWALPVSKELFVKQAKEAMEDPYYFDENGEKVTYEDTMYINNEEVKLPNLTQEQVDDYVSFVESVNKPNYYNEAIQNIISEEAAAFYEGQKSAEDVANIIQSRVQIYVNENR